MDNTLIHAARCMTSLRYNPSESEIQKSLIEWARLFPDERRLMFHIPNEAKRSKLGYIGQAVMGTRAGAADLFVPMARAGWNGLFLELKSAGNNPTKTQVAFGADMNACGYAWAWADTIDDAVGIVTRYAAGLIARPNWVHYGAKAIAP
jgi:hypothetical protein